ncbi:MAG: CRISPR-associated endonuclease Cas1, partial [Mariprofundaceae bacterium]
MQTVLIDRRATHLSLDGQRLRIESPGERPRFVPISGVSRLVVCAGGVTLTSSLLAALAGQGAGALILSPRDHRRTAIVLPPFGGDHAARLSQYRAATDTTFATEVARAILRLKLRAQVRAVRRMRNTPASRAVLAAWPGLRARLAEAADVESLRGVEGGAAALYFAAMRAHLPDALGFAGRRRRPAPDPVNALISLSATLLHFDAVRALHMAGLDPAIGFLHAPEYNRESLACDLIEPLRPHVEGFVLGLFASRALRADHFFTRDDACLLGKAGRRIFYEAWERAAPPYAPRRARNAPAARTDPHAPARAPTGSGRHRAPLPPARRDAAAC